MQASDARAPGDAGFVPPSFDPAEERQPMAAGTYTSDYVDPYGQRPGDRGFVPPLRGIDDEQRRMAKALGLPEGFDADYRDPNGRQPGEKDFIMPVYTQDYLDPSGKHVGEEGFVSPCSGPQRPLPYGCYDDGFRDGNARRPGGQTLPCHHPGFYPSF